MSNAVAPEATAVSTPENGELRVVQVDLIDRNPQNPRKHFDEEKLKELTASVAVHGVLQPILVRPAGKRFELVAGERRWRACQAAGVAQVTAIVRELTDEAALEIAVIENSQREDVNPVDEAAAFAAYIKRSTESDPIATLARKIGHPAAYVKRRLALVALSKKAAAQVAGGQMPLGTALIFSRLPGSMQDQILGESKRHGHSIKALTWTIERRVCSLKAAVFDKTACAACQHNGANETDLFGTSEAFNGNCLRPECYNRKLEEYVTARRAELNLKGCAMLSNREFENGYHFGNKYVDLRPEYGGGVSAKIMKTKCQAGCEHLRSYINDAGKMFVLCANVKCRNKLIGKSARTSNSGNAVEGSGPSPAVLKQQRMGIAADFATAWLAKTWAEWVIVDGNGSPAARLELLKRALDAQISGHGYGEAGQWLDEYLGLDREFDAAWSETDVLYRLCAVGIYDSAGEGHLTKDKTVPAAVRDIAARNFILPENFVGEHLKDNVRTIAKNLGLIKVPQKRGDAVAAIMEAKLPAGSLTDELKAAFSGPVAKKAGAKKTKKAPAKKKATKKSA